MIIRCPYCEDSSDVDIVLPLPILLINILLDWALFYIRMAPNPAGATESASSRSILE